MLVCVVAHQYLLIAGHYRGDPVLREQVAEHIALYPMLGEARRQLTGPCVVDPEHTMLLVVLVHEPAIEGVELIRDDLAIVPEVVSSESDHSILDVDQA